MREMADALISSGMYAAGYDTVNVVCNGWGARDPITHNLTDNKARWPEGMKGLGDYLHSKSIKMGCYTSPATDNCCGEPGSLGYEDIDMEFFAQVGCDHVMVDWCRAYHNPLESKTEYALIGEAIANSSNPNMIYGIWHTGFGKSWKWYAEAGGHYTRVATDMSNNWAHSGCDNQPGSVLENFDTAMSIPNIQSKTYPGRYIFLDSLVVGTVRVFRQEFTLEDAIGSHACSFDALAGV
jgi:alpha-galactosidase